MCCCLVCGIVAEYNVMLSGLMWCMDALIYKCMHACMSSRMHLCGVSISCNRHMSACVLVRACIYVDMCLCMHVCMCMYFNVFMRVHM